MSEIFRPAVKFKFKKSFKHGKHTQNRTQNARLEQEIRRGLGNKRGEPDQ
jgi:hypothetical protein